MQSLLVANRGEIACRIIRTARRLGLRTIAVHSEADERAAHVQLADSAVYVGESPASQSYLDIQRIIDAAHQSHADAIHPGYGFLSENPALVDACEEAGIVFVGPGSEAIRRMGLKDSAKRLMEQAGVPVVPGYHGESQEPERLRREAAEIGYPVLIKARAGGGGKGMRRVDSEQEFDAALGAAQREASASFGDEQVLIERFVSAPRHVEVQVFGDSHGNVVHLFERDCSLQRRHQKVIEEAPAPGMTETVRQAMTDAAVRAAKAIDYRGAGTIEFIVDGSRGLQADSFWFMEMNTRLQVEHPVTEAITGIDLVEWQLRVAAGEPLPLTQEQLRIQGHAVEARLYAENPASGFLPATGELKRFRLSSDIRADSGINEGDHVTSHYDPLLAKLIAHAPEREQAFRQLSSGLASSVVLGVTTNREFLMQLVDHPQVRQARFDTAFIDNALTQLLDAGKSEWMLAVAALHQVAPFASTDGCEPLAQRLGAWQLWGEARRQLELIGPQGRAGLDLQVVADAGNGSNRCWQVHGSPEVGFPAKGVRVQFVDAQRVRVDGQSFEYHILSQADRLWLQLGSWSSEFALPLSDEAQAAGPAEDAILSPMPGRVVSVGCQPGDAVRAGQALIVVEAMKMEQELSCMRDGVVETVGVRCDDQISQGQELLRLVAIRDEH